MKTLTPTLAIAICLIAVSTAAAQSPGRRGFVPRHRAVETLVIQEQPIEGGEVVVDENVPVGPGVVHEPELLEFWDGETHGAGTLGGCSCGDGAGRDCAGRDCAGGDSCSGGACGLGGCGDGACGRGCLIPCPWLCFDNIELMAGVSGFTGPNNRGETGSFGFYEGMNWGAPLPCIGCGELGIQLGARAAQANLSGAEFTTNQRDQLFATGGIFRRVDWGFQGGVVVDYMHEDWYAEVDLVQIRAELSWLYPNCHELGAFVTAATDSDQAPSLVNSVIINETFESTDLYAFFYRHRHDSGDWRIFAGFTGESDGLLGAEFQNALSDCWAFEGGFTYLLPEEGASARGHEQESWNVGLGLVWYPGRRNARGDDYYRPLFNVADNGSFMVDRR
jgi:hypothetical protein